MSAAANELAERKRLSKVSFSPISSDVLCVKIRSVSREEDPSAMSSVFQTVRENTAGESESHSKSTMTDNKKTSSISSQTAEKERKVPTIQVQGSSHDHDSVPCLRHAAENISRKASDVPSERINLCNNCSKSMLSYIFVVQDFLDSLAREISGGEKAPCLQCARQELRKSIAGSTLKDVASPNDEHAARTHPDHSSSVRTESKHDKSSSKRTSRAKSHRQDSWKNEDASKGFESTPPHRRVNQEYREFNNSATPSSFKDANAQNISNIHSEKSPAKGESSFGSQTVQQQPTSSFNRHGAATSDGSNYQQSSVSDHQNNQQWTQSTNHAVSDSNEVKHGAPSENPSNRDQSVPHHADGDNAQHFFSHHQAKDAEKPIFRAPSERFQPNYDAVSPIPPNGSSGNDQNNDTAAQSPTLFREGVDGIISTLSNAEREVYDSARNHAGWESLGESQERLGLPNSNVISSEAFVTSCRNNAEAIGCLVVGTSLLLCRTSRTLCVLVSDGVSTAFRNALNSVFQVVQYVRSLDSLGTTKLALLEQPELGITFEKLNVWRLSQFNKCIYLNPDTLVIQNCDELFCREELSAVPDIGWPDCFNSGVFVYSPSVSTFWQLLEFAEKQGSYDGGDQGLLNSYFNSWSLDMSKKLSFIYNLMANVSYTYAPAFRQFGRDVKIVQFHGSFKPWHVKFFSKTGQISPSSPVHPTYVQFVHIWINIFRISVLRLLSQEIQSYAASQETICAVETLRFFPLPLESESEFFLTPPSVRLRLAEKKLRRSTSLPISEARRRKSAEFPRYTGTEEEEDIPESSGGVGKKLEGETVTAATVEEKPKTADEGTASEEKLQTRTSETDEVLDEVQVKEKVKDENSLPGAEVGNYQGMKAWEQGRMDYQGTDSSDNVIKRLEFLMSSRQ